MVSKVKAKLSRHLAVTDFVHELWSTGRPIFCQHEAPDTDLKACRLWWPDVIPQTWGPRSESPIRWQGWIKTHRITQRRLESYISGLAEVNPPDITPGVMSGGSNPVLKFSFQNPLSCNRKRHCILCPNSTGGYVLGVSSGLATGSEVQNPLVSAFDRGFWPRGFMSANRRLRIPHGGTMHFVIVRTLSAVGYIGITHSRQCSN